MKVLILGAAGKTGRLVVDQALAVGHKVVAFVHAAPEGKEQEDQKHPFPPTAEVIHGDVQNPTRLEHAMQGCEAVIDTLGGKTPWKSTELEANAARVVLEVMERVGAKRLIVISVLGAGENEGQIPFMYEHLLMPTYLRGAIKDKNEMESEVRSSQVEWVLVRPPVLNDHDATGSIHIVPAHEIAHHLTRADLAHFLVDQLTSNQHVGQTVTIANT
jgi:putative NADH-flavin reductase